MRRGTCGANGGGADGSDRGDRRWSGVTALHRVLVLVPALFGLVTLFAAGRILLGLGEAGYVVFRPLLIFNAVMGLVYLGTAFAIRRDPRLGRSLAGGVALINLAVFVAVILLYRSGQAVAVESVRAMAFRTVVWLGIVLGLWWLIRGRRRARAG